MKKALPLLLVPFLQQCATKPAADDDHGLSRPLFHNLPESKSLAGVTIPILRSPTLDKRWGRPAIYVTADGGYLLDYSKPGEHRETLSIYATPGTIDSDTPEPPGYNEMGTYYTQKWHSVRILGRPIHVYTDNPGGGADSLLLSTVTFPVNLPGKPAASYRITGTSNLGDAGEYIDSYMKTVAFE